MAKKEWKDMSRGEKITGIVILAIIGVLIIMSIPSGGGESNTSAEDTQANNMDAATDENALVDKVDAELNKLDEDTRSSLASTSVGGYQGNITSIEPAGKDTVIVKVSTYFNEPGNENDGGKNIASKLFNMVCMEVPELNSLYVISDSSGLESHSVYRSDVPFCR